MEDEPDIRELLENYLTHEGYEVRSAEDGVAALSLFSKESFADVPVIFLSALGDEKSLLKGYDSMADDYVTKPFSMPVFLRKVHAVLRRGDATSAANSGAVLSYGPILVNTDTMEVMAGKTKVDLTTREFDLLVLFLKNPGRVFTREMLLDMLWDYNSFVDERIVDSHIKNLRHKLGEAGSLIETVRGRGYKVAKEIS